MVHLHDRVKNGDLDYIKRVKPYVLLKARDGDGMSVLSIAAINNQLDCCKEILKKCPSLLYCQNNLKSTVIHATHYGSGGGIFMFVDFFLRFGLDAALREGDVESGMERFKRWIKLQNHTADTCLTEVVIYRNHEIARRFVEVDLQYKIGLSGIAGYNGKTAMQLAVDNQDQVMIKLLTDGQNLDLDSMSFPVHLFDRVKRGDLDYINTVSLDVLQNTRDDYQMSALSIATIEDQFDCCKEILRRCPSLLYHKNSTNNTVLHHATYYGTGGGILRMVDFFLSAGLFAAFSVVRVDEGIARFKRWIKLQNNHGDTGLTHAAYYRNHDIMKRFLELDRRYKLGLSQMDGYQGKTAMEWALEYQDDEMIRLLSDGGNAYLDYVAITDGKTPVSIDLPQAQRTQKFEKTSDTAGDWLDYMGTSEDSTVANEHKLFTLAEVSKHNNSQDCWLVINGKVYDVTNFLLTHPGGKKILLKAAGKDATSDFEELHHHSHIAMTIMDDFYVGVCDSITSLLTKLANEEPQPYSHKQLVDFTDDFSHRLGSGSFGNVYKGKLPNGVLIAVKVLKDIEGKDKSMDAQFGVEVDTMGRAYHRNLIKLYGYCYEVDKKFKALIYDYMENGSFDKVLFEKKHDLPWKKLYSIAKEIAQGIAYLHENCHPQIIHLDIKPGNVLLDSKFSPKVIDFGLAEVGMGEGRLEQLKVKGSPNYMAPEVNQVKEVILTSKCDVYSFGMLLFDILGSKRNNIDNRLWFPGQVWEKFKTNQLDGFIFDCGIKEEDKDNAKRLSIVALLCVEHNPIARPTMSTVVKMLEGKIEQLDTPVTPFLSFFPSYYLPSVTNSIRDSRDNYSYAL